MKTPNLEKEVTVKYCIIYTKVYFGKNESGQMESKDSDGEKELKVGNKKEAVKEYRKFKRATEDYLRSFGEKARVKYTFKGLFKRDKKGKLIRVVVK